MTGLEIQSTGEIVATYNGDVVENAKWNMDYDGETMDIETLRNNELAIIQLDNNDLSRLLQGIGMHRENGLEERLKRDFRQGSEQSSAPARRSSPKCSRQGSAPARRSSPKRSSPKRSSPKRSSPKTKRVRFMDDNLRKSGKQKHKIIIRKQGSVQGSAPARRSKRRSSPRSNKSSPRSKRGSPRSKRGSPRSNKSSPKRSSPKRSSPKRSSPRRKKKSSNKKTRKKIIVQEGEWEGEGENMDLDLDVDFDYDFNSRPDIEKTIY